MSVVPIILQKGQMILTQIESVAVFTYHNYPFKVGTITDINDLSELYSEGDTVVYSPFGAVNFKYSSTDYVLITEDKIIYKYEPAAP